MRQWSMEQDFGSISSSHGIWFCLAKDRLLIHQKTSNYLAASDPIFTDGLLELQRLNKITFFVALCVSTLNFCYTLDKVYPLACSMTNFITSVIFTHELISINIISYSFFFIVLISLPSTTQAYLSYRLSWM